MKKITTSQHVILTVSLMMSAFSKFDAWRGVFRLVFSYFIIPNMLSVFSYIYPRHWKAPWCGTPTSFHPWFGELSCHFAWSQRDRFSWTLGATVSLRSLLVSPDKLNRTLYWIICFFARWAPFFFILPLLSLNRQFIYFWAFFRCLLMFIVLLTLLLVTYFATGCSWIMPFSTVISVPLMRTTFFDYCA